MTVTFTTGDTRRELAGQVLSDGAGVNVAGSTGELHIRRPDGAVLIVTPAWTDTAVGTWSYAWQPGDLALPGTWRVELQVTYSDNGIQTFGPYSFAVRPEIDGPPPPALPMESIIDGGSADLPTELVFDGGSP